MDDLNESITDALQEYKEKMKAAQRGANRAFDERDAAIKERDLAEKQVRDITRDRDAWKKRALEAEERLNES